jgi:hypothetical protein
VRDCQRRRCPPCRENQKNRLIRPGHDTIPSERFSALILTEKRRLAKIEKTLGINSPDVEFRSSLTRTLWGFYRLCLKIRYRKATKEALRKAPYHLEQAEKWTALVRDADDPAARHHLLSRFDAIGQNWQPVSWDGGPWHALLREYTFTLRLLSDALPDDRGGERAAAAFDVLMRFLAEHYYARASSHEPPSNFFRFADEVTELLRKIEEQLPTAKFQLPPNDTTLASRPTDTALRSDVTSLPAETAAESIAQWVNGIASSG